MEPIAQNRRAFHDYEILERYEAGIALTGKEIKAVRARKVQLVGSHVKVLNGEAYWIGGIIQSGDKEQRTRKLLLHRKEIESLVGKGQPKGMALIPLKLYLKRNVAKLEVALTRGKKIYDKRIAIKEKEFRRSVRQL